MQISGDVVHEIMGFKRIQSTTSTQISAGSGSSTNSVVPEEKQEIHVCWQQ